MNTPDQNHERTATDDRIDENREPAVVAPATRDVNETESSGTPPGQGFDQRSPLDREFFEPKEKTGDL